MLPLVALEGTLVGEPQMKFAESTGKPMVRMRVKAANRRKDEESGRWVDTDVLWVTVTAFGKLAENAMESLVDGDQVVAIGWWSTAEWTDQSGAKRSAPKFVAQSLGAGLQFAPRRHSAETMAKHPRQAPVQRGEPGRPETDSSHGLGHRFADAAVAAQPRANDPWASDGGV